MRLRIDLAYDGTDFHGWAAQPGLRTVAGRADRGAGDGAAGAVGRRRSVPGAPTPACTRAARSCTSTSSDAAPSSRSCAGTPAERHPACRRAGTPGRSRRADGFDARFSRALAPLRLPDRRPARRGGPADPRPRAGLAAAARPGRDERGVARCCSARTTSRRSASSARAPPRSAPCSSCAGRATPTGWSVATVRADAFCHSMVRSLVGCLLAIGEGRRPPAWAGGDPARPARATRPSPWCTRTGSRWRRSATRPTTSSRARARDDRGRAGGRRD